MPRTHRFNRRYLQALARASAWAVTCALLLGACEPDSATERARQAADPEAAAFLVRAQDAYDAGAFGAALILADSAGTRAPELADVPFLRGRILTALSRLDEARAAYERVLALDPDYQGAYLNLGNLALRRSQHRAALDFFQQEQARHPSAPVWLSIGRAYEQLRRPDSARVAYEAALTADSAYASAYMRLGQLLKDQGAIEQALAVSRQGLALEPDNTGYQYAVGALHILAGEAEAAVPLLRAVVEEQPWHYWGNYNLGRALVQVGAEADAERYLARAEALQASQGEIDHWRELAGSNPDQFMLWVKLSRALQAAGRTAEAAQADAVALTLAPRYLVQRFSDAPVRRAHRAAVDALVRKQPAGAIEQYQRALERTPTHADAWVNLGVAYAAAGQASDAERAWQEALEHQPGHPLAEMYLFQLAQPYTPDPDAPTGAS